jgi:hypothetical protein
MAKKKKRARATSETKPRFPYTTHAGALRKLLQEIPKRPKPGKLSLATLKTWKVTTTNDASPLRVLKELGLLSASGEPLPPYAAFMEAPPKGPRALGVRIKDVYKDLFETSHEPHKNQSDLTTFFKIHGGGGERTVDYQIQTFKALSESADFTGVSDPSGDTGDDARDGGGSGGGRMPAVKIDLHIHLPENKTARDYESIIQDIAKYIYGRSVAARA